MPIGKPSVPTSDFSATGLLDELELDDEEELDELVELELELLELLDIELELLLVMTGGLESPPPPPQPVNITHSANAPER
jgi:hypothetical protein